MISARDLHVGFGPKTVLDRIDLNVRAGERVAIVGTNGSGKTTFFRSLLGLAAYRGSLMVGAYDVQDSPEIVRQLIGYVPQRAPAFHGTLDEFVRFITALRSTDVQAADEQLDRLGLSRQRYGDVPMARLSGGMMQKALLAVALASNEQLLLLDEPTANLDPGTRRELLAAVERVSRDTTVLLSSHRVADIEALADRIVLLHEGQIIFDGATTDLTHRAEAPATVRLLVSAEAQPTAVRVLEAGAATILSANGTLTATMPSVHIADMIHQVRTAGVRIDDIVIERNTLEQQLHAIVEEHCKPSPD